MNDAPRIKGRFLRNARPAYDWPRLPDRVDENDVELDKIPRALSDNRDRYIRQSAETKGGRVPRFA